jgi:hypothetical protein
MELRTMLKLSPPPAVEDAIRKQAAQMGVPISQYLAPFVKMIADGKLTLSPRLELELPAATR